MSFLIENGILKGYDNDNNRTDIVIPEGVTAIDNEVFMDLPYINSVTIPEGVTTIGDSAFYRCENLTEITLPKTITYIGAHAFCDCKKLTSLKLPESLEVIGKYAFSDCVNLKDIDIPPSVREIGVSAFSSCPITSITIPKTIDSIPNRLFNDCEKLERIEFPDNITSIEDYAFEYCFSLREVYIPKSVRKIGRLAFGRCARLRRVTFGGDYTEIKEYAFEDEFTDLITNLSIKQWKSDYGFLKLDYAMNYMRQYTPGDPFFEDVKEENKAYIKGQLKRLLKKIAEETAPFSQYNSPDSGVSDTNVVVFLTQEKMLGIDEVDLLLEKMKGNPEAAALLLDYKAQNFSQEFLEKYETEKLQKELGLKERTVAEWKKIYNLGDDGNGGYIILGYKGEDVSIEIPEKIGKKPVTAIDDYAFSPVQPRATKKMRHTRFTLNTVIIPDSVTSIGLKAFSSCVSLNAIVYQGKTFTADDFETYWRTKNPDPK